MKRITFKFLLLLLVIFVAIFIIGIFETARNEYIFKITEDNFMNTQHLSDDLLNDYYDFRYSYIFNNSIFITFMNFSGTVLIFYLMFNAWMIGRRAPIMTLKNIFNHYGILLILMVYLVLIIFEYLVDIFLNQLIIVLFNDIYQSIYIAQLYIDYFAFFILIAYVLSFLSNQIKHFDVLN